jgi:hypothetical protein
LAISGHFSQHFRCFSFNFSNFLELLPPSFSQDIITFFFFPQALKRSRLLLLGQLISAAIWHLRLPFASSCCCSCILCCLLPQFRRLISSSIPNPHDNDANCKWEMAQGMGRQGWRLGLGAIRGQFFFLVLSFFNQQKKNAKNQKQASNKPFSFFSLKPFYSRLFCCVFLKAYF